MEPLNIMSAIIVIMLALPHIFFNRKRWAGFWIIFLVLSGFAMFYCTFALLMALAQDSTKETILTVFPCAAPTAAIPYIILKFYWGQQDKAKEFELKEWELKLKQKELNLKRRELDY